MQTNITLPDVGAGPARLSVWFADTGEIVFEGDRVVEIVVEGATFDIAAPATGRLAQKHVHPDQSVATGQILGVVDATEI